MPKISSRVAWPLWGKEDVEEGLNTIERFKSLLNVWLGMDIWKSARDITASIEDVAEEQRVNDRYIIGSVKHLSQEHRVAHHETISNIKDATEEQRTEHTYIARSIRNVAQHQERYHDSVERERIIEWLSPLNFFLRQADIFNTWQPGTGEWLLRDNAFKAWKSGTGKTVWFRGMPGAGKTVLASLVVDHLRATLESQNIGVAVIYLNHQETEAQSLPNLLAGLWRQLIIRKPISLAVKALYEKHCEQCTRPSLAEVDFILCSTISEMSNVFIIVDAVDEYPEKQRHALLRYLSALTTESTVNLMLTSRPHLNLIHVIKNLRTLEIRATMDDIRRHVDAEILKSPRLSRHIENRPQLREEIEDSIVLRSDGMFLLAKLHMDSLTTKHTVKAVRDALSNMPGNLDSTYDEVVERINRQSEDDRQLAWRTLSWVTHAKRPLRPSELREALAVEPGTTTLDRDNLLDIDTILSVCAGLIVINDGDKRLRLIHYTTQTYLDHVQSRVFPHAAIEITTTCITYLSFDTFSQTVASDPMDLFYRNSLLDYAVEYCLIHARGQPELHIPQFILDFLADCSAFWKLWNWKRGYKQCYSASRLRSIESFHLNEISRYLIEHEDGGDVLQEAAAEGLPGLVQFLIDNGIHPDATRTKDAFKYDSALQAASAQGHTNIIRLLLDHGANIDLPGSNGTALQLAALRGRKEPLCLLLSRGANANLMAGRYGTALAVAFFTGRKDFVQILLEHGAGVDSEGRECGTAVQAASRAGHPDIVRLFLEHGADVNSEGRECDTALRAASQAGHKDIVRLLLEHGADVNSGSRWNKTALQVASEKGREDMARLLIEHGADVNVGGGESGSPLWEASYWGRKEVVKLLLEHGADESFVGGWRNCTPLNVASWRGRKDIVRLLLEHGADVNGEGLDGTALRAASGAGHEDIVRLLIKHGADVNVGGGESGSPLWEASYWGRKEVVKLLLEHGADESFVGGWRNCTPLNVASWRGRKDIVRLLLEHGADVNSGGEGHGTALQAASEAGHEDIVRLLIEHGADVNVGGGALGSPLWAAALEGRKKIVELLLEHGADVNFVGGSPEECTPLEVAALWVYKDIVQLLIQHGAKDS
ncbi:ankyrin repeat-containing domain protein [Mycena rosella]|uniref:Ankyrin repeat-containing domain protein n=1 Tax=Mycena rosella TaxID=1033263 RepID=A0AAD7GWD8_MYCRO|nr:ankyrin repeat-containing domain protein [Mycena rosella]